MVDNIPERIARLEEKANSLETDIEKLESMYGQLSEDIHDLKMEMGDKRAFEPQ